MPSRRVLLLLPLALGACASLPGREPLNVLLVGVESQGGEGLELRLAVKLRIQNPNDTPIDYDGVSLDLEVRGRDFASGVSDARGSVPRFGETVLTVPVSVSATAMIKQAYSALRGEPGPIDFVAKGRLAGGLLGGARFVSRGRFDWPGSP
jgi:LEA14-like dessication related protein